MQADDSPVESLSAAPKAQRPVKPPRPAPPCPFEYHPNGPVHRRRTVPRRPEMNTYSSASRPQSPVAPRSVTPTVQIAAQDSSTSAPAAVSRFPAHFICDETRLGFDYLSLSPSIFLTSHSPFFLSLCATPRDFCPFIQIAAGRRAREVSSPAFTLSTAPLTTCHVLLDQIR